MSQCNGTPNCACGCPATIARYREMSIKYPNIVIFTKINGKYEYNYEKTMWIRGLK